MATKATDKVTVYDHTDTVRVVPWYHKQLRTDTTTPTITPGDMSPSGWTTTEPSVTSASDLNYKVFIAHQNVYGNNTCWWGDVSLYSSYEAAIQAYNKALSAETISTETNAYFWNKVTDPGNGVGAGAHITGIEQDDFIANPSNGGRNVLINPSGVLMRNGVTTRSSFGDSKITIGEDEKSRLEITNTNFKVIAENGASAFDINASSDNTSTQRQYMNDWYYSFDQSTGDIIYQLNNLSDYVSSGDTFTLTIDYNASYTVNPSTIPTYGTSGRRSNTFIYGTNDSWQISISFSLVQHDFGTINISYSNSNRFTCRITKNSNYDQIDFSIGAFVDKDVYTPVTTISGLAVHNNPSGDNTSIKSDGLILSQGAIVAPIGSVQMYAGPLYKYTGSLAQDITPKGWLACDGKTYNIADYPKLFAVIGTTWGGNGTTTFAVPDLRGRAPIGVNHTGSTPAGATTSVSVRQLGTNNLGSENAIVPYHNHSIAAQSITGGSHNHNIKYYTYATSTSGTNRRFGPYAASASSGDAVSTSSETHTHSLAAHNTNYAGTSGNTTGANMQPSAVLNFIICAGEKVTS